MPATRERCGAAKTRATRHVRRHRREAAVPPARVTLQAVVQGPQTAIVVGPAGDEIYTDKYGRVKVQFHWDRDGKRDENSSCWMRVSQIWAGKGWGSFIPRIGQEVIVEFLEGDPDQPDHHRQRPQRRTTCRHAATPVS